MNSELRELKPTLANLMGLPAGQIYTSDLLRKWVGIYILDHNLDVDTDANLVERQFYMEDVVLDYNLANLLNAEAGQRTSFNTLITTINTYLTRRATFHQLSQTELKFLKEQETELNKRLDQIFETTFYGN